MGLKPAIAKGTMAAAITAYSSAVTPFRSVNARAALRFVQTIMVSPR